jgi:hypothetical protein
MVKDILILRAVDSIILIVMVVTTSVLFFVFSFGHEKDETCEKLKSN